MAKAKGNAVIAYTRTADEPQIRPNKDADPPDKVCRSALTEAQAGAYVGGAVFTDFNVYVVNFSVSG